MWRAPVSVAAPVLENAPAVDETAKGGPGDGSSLAERMQTLERLRAEGLVDDGEYAEQRDRLLNEI
jgi:hypothetical protein